MTTNNDPFLDHEALHMSSKLLELVNEWLIEHPAITNNPNRRKLAEIAAESLMSLYQLIGSEHGYGVSMNEEVCGCAQAIPSCPKCRREFYKPKNAH